MNDSSSSGGVGLFGMLGIVFVTLKLMGHINWSWWWVMLPFWGGFALVGVILITLFIVHLIFGD